MGVRRHRSLLESYIDQPTTWQPGIDKQAKALHGTKQWLYRTEALQAEDLYRRMYLLRQTVWGTTHGYEINDKRPLNGPKKTEEE